MGNPELTPLGHFTYRQYRTWPDSERWELIDGIAWSMSAAPHHQCQWRDDATSTLVTILSVSTSAIEDAQFGVLQYRLIYGGLYLRPNDRNLLRQATR